MHRQMGVEVVEPSLTDLTQPEPKSRSRFGSGQKISCRFGLGLGENGFEWNNSGLNLSNLYHTSLSTELLNCCEE